jgi:nucleoid-associated protein YgaU
MNKKLLTPKYFGSKNIIKRGNKLWDISNRY